MSNRKTQIAIAVVMSQSLFGMPVLADQSWHCSSGATGLWACTQSESQALNSDVASTFDEVVSATTNEDYLYNPSQIVSSQSHYDFTVPHGCFMPYTGPELGSIDEDRFNAAPIYVQSDATEFLEGGSSILSGDVQVTKNQRQIDANAIYYHQPTNTFSSQGGFRYSEPGLQLIGDEAEIDLDKNLIKAQNIHYQVHQKNARGHAGSVLRKNDTVTELTNASYTTCAPGAEDWRIEAESIKLNSETGRGQAKHAKFRVHDVPVAYLPYYSFPIDDRRKSGFLTPSFGQSEDSGFEASIPFYWNIAPNYDATLTPKYYSKRGIQLQNEFRYLTERHEGVATLEVMPHDRQFNKERILASLVHTANFNDHWHGNLDINHVTDDEYFDDLDDNLGLERLNHIRREGQLFYDTDAVSLTTRVQGFQTIDPLIGELDRPYDRLPQVLLVLRTPAPYYGFDFGFSSEVVYFDRSDSQAAGIRAETDAGLRVNLRPEVRLPLEAAYGHITPSLKYQYTYYDLSKEADGINSTLDRSLPILSVDSELYFERQTTLFGQAYLHTLTPRIYYLYVPERAQDDIPLFDSALSSLTYQNLFRYNRFSGTDRIGDANQLTLAITTALLEEPTLSQRLRARIGQILFFQDRQVNVTKGRRIEDRTSPLFADLVMQLHKHWQASSYLEWNYEEQDSIERFSTLLQYRPGPFQVVNLGYFYRQDLSGRHEDQNQLQASFAWPLGQQWSLLGSTHYDLEDGQAIEILGGIEFDSCCWAVRFVAHRELERHEKDPEDGVEIDNTFYLQIELKGLAGLGRKSDSLLSTLVPGYDPDLNKGLSGFYE